MIRAAGQADIPAIATLWNRMILDTTATFTTEEKSEHALQQLVADRPDAFWVAGQDRVTGFVTWGPFRAGPGYRHTVEHTIISAVPLEGTGSALMRHALVTAAGQGHHAMIAAISGENADAQVFHARLGFVAVGHLPQVGRKAGRWLDLILMQKMLETT